MVALAKTWVASSPVASALASAFLAPSAASMIYSYEVWGGRVRGPRGEAQQVGIDPRRANEELQHDTNLVVAHPDTAVGKVEGHDPVDEGLALGVASRCALGQERCTRSGAGRGKGRDGVLRSLFFLASRSRSVTTTPAELD